jgi:hypothetical protein
LRPTPEEVLNSISYTFDELIRPDPASPLAISYSLTVSNMLRQLMLTMKHEERAIHDDGAELRAVLRQAYGWLRANDGGGEAAAKLGAALSLETDPVTPARSSRDNWRELRWALEAAIKRMQALRGSHGDSADYKVVRQAMRDYLDASLDREKILIDGAFTLARR